MATRRKFGRREPIGVTVRRNRAAMLAMAPTPEIAAQIDARIFSEMPALPKKRKMRGVDIDRVHRKQPVPLERQVLKAVIHALRHDPRVANVERNQSGVFMEGNRYVRVGTPGKLDLTVYLHSGRYIEIEVKRPGGKPAPHQAERIAAIRANGGLAGYCWSAESALALLP